MNAFWINVLISSFFFLLSIPIAIKLIPYYTIKQLRDRNKNHVVRKVSSVIQEICEYLNSLPFKDDVLLQDQLSIFTSKRNLNKKKNYENYKFVGLVNINVLNPIVFPKIILVISDHFHLLDTECSFNLLRVERQKLEVFRLKLESIIGIHSLHVDDRILSAISDVCLDIRAFELSFEFNNAIDDLIESGETERIGVFGIMDFAKINRQILYLLKVLICNKNFEHEVKKK